MTKTRSAFFTAWGSKWLNIATLVVFLGLVFLFAARVYHGDVQFVQGSYPALSQTSGDVSSQESHDSLDISKSFVSHGIVGDSTVTWSIPVELVSDHEDMTWGIYGAIYDAQIEWDGQVIGGVGIFGDSSTSSMTGGRLIVTLPPELTVEGTHELTLTVVGQGGDGRLSGELLWGARADVLSYFQYLRFMATAIQATCSVLAITFLIIAAVGFHRSEFLIWGWYMLALTLVAPAFSGLWDHFSLSVELQRRAQFVGLLIVPFSSILMPAWMVGIHNKRRVYLPVIVATVVAVVMGFILELGTLRSMSFGLGVFSLLVGITATIWTTFLALKGNREAKFFTIVAVSLTFGAVLAVLFAVGSVSEYQILLPCAAISSGATAVYFIVRHSGLANRYISLVNIVGDGIIVVDKDGRIREANLPAKTLLSDKLGLFTRSLKKSEHSMFFDHTYGDSVGRREEFRLEGPSGSTLVESMSVRLREGTTLLSLRDIRDRMEFELSMAQAARIETTELVVIALARDLRACVSSISTASEGLKDTCHSGKAKVRFDRFLDVLNRCAYLGDQLSMLASGVGVEAEFFVLDGLLEEVLGSLSEGIGAEVQLHLSLEAKQTKVNGVVQEIESIITNLVFNSRDALGENGGNIWVESRVRDDGVEVSFEDDGPGIPEELWDRVWEPFFSTKGRGQGGGVGLSVVDRVVRRHNGRREIQRGKRFGGAKMVIVLPSSDVLK